ncbi:queuosine salvage protein isoform X2 [Erpetoichthys calabaricus]|nr:queuosine salvage protein isoform X2 [Erpetoichthys calabaricus]XP_028658256.1 queuosine salvage protein isoform X2 [Erpetoichthys calabaricus]
METPLSPRESGEYIHENSKDVYINEEGVKRIAELLYAKQGTEELSVNGWKHQNPLAPANTDDNSINWVYVVDTLNFSFWPDDDNKPCLVCYKGKTYSGYMALCAAITRALDEGIPITEASYFANMTLDELKHVLRSDNDVPMPMIEERHRVLNESGKILLEHGGCLRKFLSQGGRKTQQLIKFIVDNVPSYRDEACFEGKRIAFYKRAQILLADFWGILEAKGEAALPDINYLTMFADYRVPQALVYFGALQYSDKLMKTLKEGAILPPGDHRELEIRGCSIWCVEKIRDCLWDIIEQKEGQRSEDINSVIIDFFLWHYAKRHQEEMAHIPIHHTRTIYY